MSTSIRSLLLFEARTHMETNGSRRVALRYGPLARREDGLGKRQRQFLAALRALETDEDCKSRWFPTHRLLKIVRPAIATAPDPRSHMLATAAFLNSSRILLSLVRRGLIERSETREAGEIAKLTPRGRQLAAEWAERPEPHVQRRSTRSSNRQRFDHAQHTK
jgi:hypothetical protein